MRCKKAFEVLLFSLFQTAAVFTADETPAFSRSAYFTTLENKQLKGYVVKRFDSPSLLSCGQQCMRNEWCTSTNYKMSSKKESKGTCELNKHDISLVNEITNFHDQQGVIFSMLLRVNNMSVILADICDVARLAKFIWRFKNWSELWNQDFGQSNSPSWIYMQRYLAYIISHKLIAKCHKLNSCKYKEKV